LPVDLLTLSGHKLHGRRARCAVRRSTRLPALLLGHQERNRRGGTENLPGCVGLGAACDLARAELAQGAEAMTALRDRLEQGMLARVPFARVVGAGAPRLPNTSNICFGTLSAEALLHKLEGVAVYASAAPPALRQSAASGVAGDGSAREEALACIRFSLTRHPDGRHRLCNYVLPDIVQCVARAA
jgi:cysteine desulfurase